MIRDNSVCAVPRTQTGRLKVVGPIPGQELFVRDTVLTQGQNKPAIPWVPKCLLPVIKQLEREARHLCLTQWFRV